MTFQITRSDQFRPRNSSEHNMGKSLRFGRSPGPSAERFKGFTRCGLPFVSAKTGNGSNAGRKAADDVDLDDWRWSYPGFLL